MTNDEDSGRRQLSRREFLRTGLMAGVGALAVGMLSLRTPHQFEVTRLVRTVRGLRRPLKLAFLTDLHLGPYLDATDLEAWIAASNEERPDLVLLGGDIVDQRYRGDLGELRALLPTLAAPLGVYAVPGNHDRTRYRDLRRFESALNDGGVELLVNRGVQPREDLFLAGLDDLRVGSPEVAPALAAAPGGGRPLNAGAPAPEERAATLLLSHNPDVIAELPLATSSPAVDLLLAGHTHGGQIRVPGIGPLVTSSRYGARYAAGWVPAPYPAFVSRGLGVTALPIRFACPAELVIFELLPSA